MLISLTEADTVDATLTHWRGTLLWLGMAGIAAFAIAFLEAVLPMHAQSQVIYQSPAWISLLIMALVFAALAAGFRYLYMPRRARTVHRRLNQRPYDMVFDDDHMTWRSETASGGNPWSAFVKWREGGRVFLLYRSRTRFQIIPKHAFADTGAIDAFRDLLRRRISGRKA